MKPTQILSAAHIQPPANLNQTLTPAQLKGIRYEKRVLRQLKALAVANKFSLLEHNPWFSYKTPEETGICSPDFVLHLHDNTIIVIEVKLTYVALAELKLKNLYIPVLTKVYNTSVDYITICRNVTEDCVYVGYTITQAKILPFHLLHWPDIGDIVW